MGIKKEANEPVDAQKPNTNVSIGEKSTAMIIPSRNEDEKANVNHPPKSPKSPKKKFKAPLCRQWDMARNMKKGAGVRQTRRCDNLNSLLCLAEKDEIEGAELMLDVVEPHFSAFAELFMEHEKMKVWNDFINRSEEDQTMILHHLQEKKFDKYGLDVTETQAEKRPEQGQDSDDSWEELEKPEDDKRNTHPAFTAEECYKKIDSKLRAFLKKKQVPLGTLQHLEGDVLSFFNDYPTSVLVSKLGTSFERMLLHALCQYLDLTSHSFDDPCSGERQTEVENKQGVFTPPKMTLTEYLEQRSSSH